MKVIRMLALVLVLGLFAAACGEDEPEPAGSGEQDVGQAEQFPADSTMGKIQKAGEIKIGVKYDVPPFGFKNPQSGDIEGFDVDLGKAIADKLGVKPKFVEAISDNRIPFLQDGTVDLVLSTMTINAERDQEIDFSEPYYIARGRILVPQDSDITGVDSLAGKRVCTALGSTYEETLREQAPDAKLKLVQNGAVDAVSTDDVILTGMIIQDDSLKLVESEPLTTEPYGAGIKDGDTEFKQFVDGVLQDYKSGGGWADAYEKWVGQYTDEQQDPPTMTLEEAIEVTS